MPPVFIENDRFLRYTEVLRSRPPPSPQEIKRDTSSEDLHGGSRISDVVGGWVARRDLSVRDSVSQVSPEKVTKTDLQSILSNWVSNNPRNNSNTAPEIVSSATTSQHRSERQNHTVIHRTGPSQIEQQRPNKEHSYQEKTSFHEIHQSEVPEKVSSEVNPPPSDINEWIRSPVAQSDIESPNVFNGRDTLPPSQTVFTQNQQENGHYHQSANFVSEYDVRVPQQYQQTDHQQPVEDFNTQRTAEDIVNELSKDNLTATDINEYEEGRHTNPHRYITEYKDSEKIKSSVPSSENGLHPHLRSHSRSLSSNAGSTSVRIDESQINSAFKSPPQDVTYRGESPILSSRELLAAFTNGINEMEAQARNTIAESIRSRTADPKQTSSDSSHSEVPTDVVELILQRHSKHYTNEGNHTREVIHDDGSVIPPNIERGSKSGIRGSDIVSRNHNILTKREVDKLFSPNEGLSPDLMTSVRRSHEDSSELMTHIKTPLREINESPISNVAVKTPFRSSPGDDITVSVVESARKPLIGTFQNDFPPSPSRTTIPIDTSVDPTSRKVFDDRSQLTENESEEPTAVLSHGVRGSTRLVRQPLHVPVTPSKAEEATHLSNLGSDLLPVNSETPPPPPPPPPHSDKLSVCNHKAHQSLEVSQDEVTKSNPLIRTPAILNNSHVVEPPVEDRNCFSYYNLAKEEVVGIGDLRNKTPTHVKHTTTYQTTPNKDPWDRESPRTQLPQKWLRCPSCYFEWQRSAIPKGEDRSAYDVIEIKKDRDPLQPPPPPPTILPVTPQPRVASKRMSPIPASEKVCLHVFRIF